MPRGRPRKIKQPIIALNSRYSLVLRVNGQDYKAEGETLLEAIKKLAGIVQSFKTRGTLTATKDNKTISRFLYYPQMRKLFGEGTSQTVEIARISTAKFLEKMLA